VNRPPFSSADEALLRQVVERQRPDLLPLVAEAASGEVLTEQQVQSIRLAIADELVATVA
jgi:hypothetical protein